MTAYAVANLREVEMGPAVVEYLHRIDATLAPFKGRFLIHGGSKDVLEGEWPDDLVMIVFPDLALARRWYSSPAYQAIAPLRTGSARSNVILIEGVDERHRAKDILEDTSSSA